MSEVLKKKVIVSEIQETQSFGANGFKKRVLIGKTIEQYEQEIPFEFQYDQVDVLDNYKHGEEITISFNIRCKGYAKTAEEPKKYFPTLVGFKIEPLR